MALGSGGGLGIALLFVGMLLLDFGYFALLEWRGVGRTPGKRLMGLQVVAATGARLHPSSVLLRNLLRVIDNLPMFGTVGLVAAFIDPYGRRLGDLAAGTIVVRAARGELPPLAHRSDARSNVFWSDVSVRNRILSRATHAERDLLMDLTQRRDELDPLHRQRLFADTLAHLRERFGLPEQDHLSDEQAVLNVPQVLRDMRPGLGAAPRL